MFNMKSKAVLFGLGLVGVLAMELESRPGSESPARGSPASPAGQVLLNNTSTNRDSDIQNRFDIAGVTVSDGINSHLWNDNPSAARLSKASYQSDKSDLPEDDAPKIAIPMKQKIALGAGLAFFTLGGLFTGLAVGDKIQELAKNQQHSPDTLFIIAGLCCAILALTCLYYGLGLKMNKANRIPLILGFSTIVSGGLGTIFLFTDVSKVGIYITMGVGAVCAILLIISLAHFAATRLGGVNKYTAMWAAASTIALGLGATLVGVNMQEAIMDMHTKDSQFGMGPLAWIATMGALTIGFVALYCTIFSKGERSGWNMLGGLALVLSGVVTCVGIHCIGQYAKSMVGTKGIDDADNLTSFAKTDGMICFYVAAALLIFGLIYCYLAKQKMFCFGKKGGHLID